jgi:hypothetical protein
MKRSHSRPRALIGIAAGLAAFAATAALAFNQDPARLGPEGVPLPAGRALGPPRSISSGEAIDAIVCKRGETVLFHTHAHLAIFVRGAARVVPAGIGIGPPREVASTSRGAYVLAGACFAWLHTHAADGIIHTESPTARTYTLGEFFDIWGQPLGRERVGPARGAVTAFVDGRPYAGNPRRIRLRPHAQIQLDVANPIVRPERVTFPQGL